MKYENVERVTEIHRVIKKNTEAIEQIKTSDKILFRNLYFGDCVISLDNNLSSDELDRLSLGFKMDLIAHFEQLNLKLIKEIEKL